MLSAVNFSLGERRIDGQFVSIIYAVWDDLHRTLQISNSGLPRPIYCHNGEIEIIEATGLPLGLFDDAEYDEFSFQANTGDLFIFFSDGILDATNANGDLFGRRGVETIVRENCKLSAQEIVDAIFNAVQDHSSGGEAFDDQTILAIRVKGHSGKRK
jgi:sigma-B regulation protein RsbU (phosphoserine phosphatase)